MAELPETQSAECEGVLNSQLQLPEDVKAWTKDHVKHWLLMDNTVNPTIADIIYDQDISGESLLLLETSDLQSLKITLGPAKLILHKRDELVKLKKDQTGSPLRPCKPYPFNRFHDACRYKANGMLDVTETGASNLIDPCHEFKAYVNTGASSPEAKMLKFTLEVIKFGAACMNSRTNGTIHFGVGDKPDFTHGQILGVDVEDREAFVKKLNDAIEGSFEHKHFEEAKKCIKPPRFVSILNCDTTSSEKCVIEVDIVPAYAICQENIYHVFVVDRRKLKKGKVKGSETEQKKKLFYIRDGSSSRDLLAPNSQTKPLEEYERFKADITKLAELRKKEEEKHLTDIKRSVQGSRLSDMITGGSKSLDKSHFQRYILVTNKSHALQLESLEFLIELNPTAVLDFDPESSENGLFKYFDEQRKANIHSPEEYKIVEAVEDIAGKLKLTKNTSWVFCNGCSEETKKETPSDLDKWLKEKGASVRDVISFLCREDVLPKKRFLVIFLLLSSVSDMMDPMLETFSTFLQELRGTEQILCLCENETMFTSWKDLIDIHYRVDISSRSIYELSLSEINGTILSLFSDNRRSSRFLPCSGGSKVLLKKKVEDCLDTLNILCVNQCEGHNEDKQFLEENFYRGGKVSWWNFYFSEEPESAPFIKRDEYEKITRFIIPELLTLRQGCVSFHVLHVPGCGGTTLAMHVLWSLKETFRCAVLTEGPFDVANVASQVVQLLIYETAEQSRLSVLLMVDDFDEMDSIFDLQQHIDKELAEKDLRLNCPQVILLNCMRSELSDPITLSNNTVFIQNKLSEMEQKHFEKKLEKIEKTYKNFETFYGFMIMKTNFSPEYIQGIARNTLKSFNINTKHGELISVIFLLNVYCKHASLSVPLCEKFLEVETKPYCASYNVEDEFGNLSTLVTHCTVEAEVTYDALKAIHPSVAEYCLQELKTTYHISRAEITNLLLTNDKFFQCVQGKHQLMKDVHRILVKRDNVHGEQNKFSPLIQAIMKEKAGAEETVLLNAGKRLDKNAIVAQLLARYHYIKKKDFEQAKDWARKATELSQGNSYISDTWAQVMKHELKSDLASRNEDEDIITPEMLRKYLKMARSATNAFKETQTIAEMEVSKFQTATQKYNTAGYLGEIQVGMMILDILKRTPIFSSVKPVRRDIMEEFLSGKMKLKSIVEKDRKIKSYAPYYAILQEFSDLLCNLRDNMKRQFDFLDCFFVSLGPKFVQTNSQENRLQKELSRCFSCFVDLFCNCDVSPSVQKEYLQMNFQIYKGRQFLESMKADTPYGLLKCISDNISGEKMEEIVRKYRFILANPQNNKKPVKDRINFIYSVVALHSIKPDSDCVPPFEVLVEELRGIFSFPLSPKDLIPLYFIAIILLWPSQNSMLNAPELSDQLKDSVSQISHVFWDHMGLLYHGKWPIVHFYLGKKTGYDQLIHKNKVVNSTGSEESIITRWENGKIWQQETVQNLLHRVHGKVQNDVILVEVTPDVRVRVKPYYRSQICGKRDSERVSFFIGFSMKGPLAFDIQFH